MAEDCGGCPKQEGGPELTRQGFLSWLTVGLSAAIGVVLSAAGASYFVSPAFQKDDEDWIDIGSAQGLRPGAPLKVDFVARKRDAWAVTEKRSSCWVVAGENSKFTAFDPRCTHLGCPIRWEDAKKQFLCPCHAAVFDDKGAVVSGPPPRPLDQFPIKESRGRLLIQTSSKKEHA